MTKYGAALQATHGAEVEVRTFGPGGTLSDHRTSEERAAWLDSKLREWAEHTGKHAEYRAWKTRPTPVYDAGTIGLSTPAEWRAITAAISRRGFKWAHQNARAIASRSHDFADLECFEYDMWHEARRPKIPTVEELRGAIERGFTNNWHRAKGR